MFVLRAITRHVLTVVLTLGMAAEIRAAGQSTQSSDAPDDVATVKPLQSDANGEEIFAELVRQNELRSTRLKEYSALRTYSVTNLSGKVHARKTVRMEFIAPDKKTFVTTSEEGSQLVRHIVLNRLIESETSAAVGKEHHDSSITPANYTFHFLSHEEVGAHHCYMVEVIPKRKDKYLFEGRVWIDDHDFAIVKIIGHPAKKLSFWITRADFVRQYEKIGDFWLPVRDETFVDVKVYGKKILTIEHHIDSVNGVKSTSLTEQNLNIIGNYEKTKSD